MVARIAWLGLAGLGIALAGLSACRESVESRAPFVGADIVLRPDTTVVRALVPSRTTLAQLLSENGVAADMVGRTIAAVRAVFDPRKLRSAQPFELERTPRGGLLRFDYEIDDDSYVHVSLMEAAAAATNAWGELRAAILPIPKQMRELVAAGEISSDAPSLFQAMEAAGETPELSIALAQVFAGEIDFNTELQRGDRFTIAFEKLTREGRAAGYGSITAASFANDGRVLHAIRFTPPGGDPGYFDENGRSLRRFFLKSPLPFEPRITSRFSGQRMHPILGFERAHLGVDYAAPAGAPVIAVAAGQVLGATYDASNGRMVRLRHSGGYETSYLHLSSFAAGIRAGARVAQGEVIGRVGSSGLATGPHLDYRIRKNGVFVNPVTEHRRMPPGEPLPPGALPLFAAVRDQALDALKQSAKAGEAKASE